MIVIPSTNMCGVSSYTTCLDCLNGISKIIRRLFSNMPPSKLVLHCINQHSSNHRQFKAMLLLIQLERGDKDEWNQRLNSTDDIKWLPVYIEQELHELACMYHFACGIHFNRFFWSFHIIMIFSYIFCDILTATCWSSPRFIKNKASNKTWKMKIIKYTFWNKIPFYS